LISKKSAFRFHTSNLSSDPGPDITLLRPQTNGPGLRGAWDPAWAAAQTTPAYRSSAPLPPSLAGKNNDAGTSHNLCLLSNASPEQYRLPPKHNGCTADIHLRGQPARVFDVWRQAPTSEMFGPGCCFYLQLLRRISPISFESALGSQRGRNHILWAGC